ncbi:MAG: tetratricopeptide repeat protein [Deltaproteobacteria bacterium]|nr:tetratricopeptide repeat protein [Deltaproteobacteria bacterium]
MEISDDLFNRLLANGPSPGTIFLVLSRMKEEGQLRRVIQECLRALDVYPHDLHLRQLLAEAYLETDQISMAEAELDNVIFQINEQITSYRLQAKIYTRQKREQEAVEVLKIYLAHKPDDQEALQILETLQPSEEIPAEPAPPMEEVPDPVEEVTDEIAAPPTEEDLPEIATPTLAEIYFDQGQIKEAAATYEKILAQNPDNDRFRQRLDALKAMIPAEKEIEEKVEDRSRKSKEKMLTILEAWLANIREKSKAPVSVT